MIINACLPYEWSEKPDLIELDERALARAKERWTELGLSEAVPL